MKNIVLITKALEVKYDTYSLTRSLPHLLLFIFIFCISISSININKTYVNAQMLLNIIFGLIET